MHHRHAVFDGDRLPAACLHVNVAARQTRKDQRLFAMNQMAAVELGADGDGQPQPAHRRLGRGPVGYGSDEIATEPDKHLGAAVHHCLYRVDDVVSASPRWLEAEYFLELIE